MAGLYELMRQYATETRPAPSEELPHPELGKSLALFHACLLETDIERDATPGIPPTTTTELTANKTAVHTLRFMIRFSQTAISSVRGGS